MTRQKAIEEQVADQAGHGPGPYRGGPDAQFEADRSEAMRLILRAHLANGDTEAAARTAAQIAQRSGQSDGLDLLVETAVSIGAAQAARTAVSEAEAEGALPEWRVAALKARIALETGDLLAAKAILVMALDRVPDAPALRVMLTEVMVAAGTASDARAVLHHTGKPPGKPDLPDTHTAEGGPATGKHTG